MTACGCRRRSRSGGGAAASATSSQVDEVPGGVQETVDLVVDVRDASKPACAARALWRHYPAELFG